jgi:hypothetical protein
MNTNNNSISKSEAFPNQIAAWSSDAGLSVTVISTTEKGTIAALKAANFLAADLDAAITLLNLEIVPASCPLYRPAASLKYAMNRQRFMLRQSGATATDVDLKIRLCRDWSSGVQRLLRRRSLIVIGGRRRWWVSRAEKLEKVLRDLGHHVIFVDIIQEQNKSSQNNNCRFRFGRNGGPLYTQDETERSAFGARTRKASNSYASKFTAKADPRRLR